MRFEEIDKRIEIKNEEWRKINIEKEEENEENESDIRRIERKRERGKMK